MMMRVEPQRKRFILVSAVAILLCIGFDVAGPAEPSLCFEQCDGREWWYLLSQIDRISFGRDSLYVAAVGGTDHYVLRSLVNVEFMITEPPCTSVEGPDPTESRKLHLFQNQPNPFLSRTRIAFELSRRGRAELPRR